MLYHKWNSEIAGTFFLNVWHWLSRQYAIWSHQFCSRSVFMWLSRASNLCNHELFCLFLFWTILLRVIVFKFFIFFNSGNVLVTLEITPTTLKMQPCIFCVSRPFDLVFDWSMSLQFFPTYWFKHYIIYYAGQILSYWWTFFSHCTNIVSNILDKVILITLSMFRIIIITGKIDFCTFGGQSHHIKIVCPQLVDINCLSNYFFYLSLFTGIGPRNASEINLNCSSPCGFVLFRSMLIVATPELLLALLYPVGLLWKVSNYFPISALTLSMFLAQEPQQNFPWC